MNTMEIRFTPYINNNNEFTNRNATHGQEAHADKISDTLRELIEGITKYKRYRRPVNDFLLFCKKHRGKVSAHFAENSTPKENRFITRKLGLWWGLLTQEQKIPYKLLADKYKAIYLEKFPDYRWGKSHHHQPGQEAFEPAHLASTATEDMGNSPSDAIGGESTLDHEESEDSILWVARCLLEMSAGWGLPQMTTFKLADETQMGSLSSLMGTGHGNLQTRMISDTVNSDSALVHNYSAAQTFVNHETQELLVANNREEPCANMRQHFLAQTRPKTEQPAMSSSTPAGPARASRTCKGKRYEAFMQEQNLTRQPLCSARNKRLRINSSSSITVTDAHADPSTSNTSRVASVGAEDGGHDVDESAIFSWLSDYEKLNDEIVELPSFDLNEFLDKQKCDKRRKKPHVSSKAARKRKASMSSASTPSAEAIVVPSTSSLSVPSQAPNSSIPTPSAEANVLPGISSLPAPPIVVPPADALITTAMIEPVPPTTPQTSTVSPAKIVGCRKRKAPKEHIVHLPVQQV